jgi:hypothetical protein
MFAPRENHSLPIRVLNQTTRGDISSPPRAYDAYDVTLETAGLQPGITILDRT